jgi:hypothetical protein
MNRFVTVLDTYVLLSFCVVATQMTLARHLANQP